MTERTRKQVETVLLIEHDERRGFNSVTFSLLGREDNEPHPTGLRTSSFTGLVEADDYLYAYPSRTCGKALRDLCLHLHPFDSGHGAKLIGGEPSYRFPGILGEREIEHCLKTIKSLNRWLDKHLHDEAGDNVAWATAQALLFAEWAGATLVCVRDKRGFDSSWSASTWKWTPIKKNREAAAVVVAAELWQCLKRHVPEQRTA